MAQTLKHPSNDMLRNMAFPFQIVLQSFFQRYISKDGDFCRPGRCVAKSPPSAIRGHMGGIRDNISAGSQGQTDSLMKLVKNHFRGFLHLCRAKELFPNCIGTYYSSGFLMTRPGRFSRSGNPHCPHTRFAGQKNNLYNGKG